MILSDPINPGNTWDPTDIINYLFLSSCQTADIMWETQDSGSNIFSTVNNFPQMDNIWAVYGCMAVYQIPG